MNATEKTLVLKPYEKTGFEESLESVPLDPHMPMLPLIHKADTVERPGRDDPTAEDYFASGAIMPAPCDVFGEDLVYTFVGRPAFRELQRPVCFILRPEPELLQNLFIFDTGAYFTDRYQKIVDNHLDINRFRIPADEDSIRRFITLHFGDNESYFWGASRKKQEIELMNSLEEFSYSMLLRVFKFRDLNFDTRCRTLENILRTAIPLDPYLQAVILPESQSENQTIQSFRERSSRDFEILCYDDERGQAPAKTCNTRIDSVLLKYYADKGYIEYAL